MGRPKGQRNPDYEFVRARLVTSLQKRLGEADGARVSFRELAAACGVSVTTLRHYFAHREGAITAVLVGFHRGNLERLQRIAAGDLPSLELSLGLVLTQLREDLTATAAIEHTIGLATGLRQPVLGPLYLQEVLEPLLQAVEARLSRHIARGDMPSVDVRHAALMLVSTPLFAWFHQHTLGGQAVRSWNLQEAEAAHLQAFLRAFGSDNSREANSGNSDDGDDRDEKRKKAKKKKD